MAVTQDISPTLSKAMRVLHCHDPATVQRIASPIEYAFARAYVELFSQRDHELYEVAMWDDMDFYGSEFPSTHLAQFDAIVPQVVAGRYRIDFVVARWCASAHDESEHHILKRLPLIAVECDGHEFHEKTREQVRADKQRDRYLTRQSYRLLRFTGSEIHKDATACAAEVNATFDAMYLESEGGNY